MQIAVLTIERCEMSSCYGIPLATTAPAELPSESPAAQDETATLVTTASSAQQAVSPGRRPAMKSLPQQDISKCPDDVADFPRIKIPPNALMTWQEFHATKVPSDAQRTWQAPRNKVLSKASLLPPTLHNCTGPCSTSCTRAPPKAPEAKQRVLIKRAI